MCIPRNQVSNRPSDSPWCSRRGVTIVDTSYVSIKESLQLESTEQTLQNLGSAGQIVTLPVEGNMRPCSESNLRIDFGFERCSSKDFSPKASCFRSLSKRVDNIQHSSNNDEVKKGFEKCLTCGFFSTENVLTFLSPIWP